LPLIDLPNLYCLRDQHRSIGVIFEDIRAEYLARSSLTLTPIGLRFGSGAAIKRQKPDTLFSIRRQRRRRQWA